MKFLILALTLCFSTVSFAGNIEVSVGVTQFTQQTNGFWYQEGFPHKLQLTSPAASVKYYTDIDSGRLQLGVGYHFLGKAKSSALATASDENYNSNTHACNGPCWPMSHWYGSGSIHGVSASVRMYDKSLSWFIEGGVMASRATWSVYIPDLLNCATCTPYPFTATHTPRIAIDPMLAIGYTKGNWVMQLSIVPTHAPGDQYPAIFKGASPQLLIGYKF
jgi:hypothetical protein